MILNAIVENKLPPEEVEDMVLVILSDMQMDCADPMCISTTLYEQIRALYADAGKRVCGTPYNPPHILFWNLRSTSGFPSLSSVKNASFMSGFSPSLLNLFCEKGIDAFQNCSPWNIFLESLENPRYKIMSDKIKEFF